MAGDFVSRFQVGVECGFLDVTALGGTRRIDVDRRQGFRMIDDDGATRRQRHFAAIRQFDLTLDLIPIEERDVVLILASLVNELRHHLLQETLDQLECARVIDEDFVDVAAQMVAQRSNDDIAFLEDQQRGSFLLG